MKKPTQGDKPAENGAGKCSDEAFCKRYPTIVNYLTDEKWDDGSAREVSALSVSVRDGMIALALNDKEAKSSLYTQAETLPEALKLMEGALVDGSGAWRVWKTGKKRS